MSAENKLILKLERQIKSAKDKINKSIEQREAGAPGEADKTLLDARHELMVAVEFLRIG